ncbi:MAG: N-acetylmuramoyl-L-alanine amidase [Acetatifactor sp.]|nr:N-acetylmuramoyl-L-alanine amidase [Acetatifactor sp.]
MLYAAAGHGLRSVAVTVQAQELQSVAAEDDWKEILAEQGAVMQSVKVETVSDGDIIHSLGVYEDGTYTEANREDILIVLDPGHGGEDDGCVRQGIQEKDINLQIAHAVQTRLEELGYQVMFTRDSDNPLSLEERVQLANDAHADLYVSIHQNACEDNAPEGVEVWYCEETYGEASERLARLLSKFVVQETGAENREICETDSLYVIRESTMPSCLVETGFLSNANERAKLTNPEYQDRIAAGIVDGIDLYFYPKTMYLTFDDGPSEENTNAVLDILKERGIHATFFVIGENVRSHPEVAQRIVAEGHTIGIHCNSHKYEDIYASVDSYLADFEEAYQIVYETTGVKAELFRFPGGSINSYNGKVYQEIIEEMEERGFIYYDWNASFEDAVRKPNAEKLIQNAVSSTLGRKKVVMLAHDVIYATTLCLEDVLDSLPEYRMLPLSADVEPVQF